MLKDVISNPKLDLRITMENSVSVPSIIGQKLTCMLEVFANYSEVFI